MKVWSNIVFYVLLISAISPSQQVKKLSVDSPTLCSKTTKRKLKYESLVVTDVRTRNGIFPKICKFEVKSFYKYGGVIAVIENLNLMTKYNSNECREYVQFRTKNGISSPRYCGLDESMITTVPLTEDVSPKIRLHPYLNAQEVANNSFIDVDGEMDVIIFLTEGGIEQYNKTLFRIVFTSYVDCSLNANLSNMKDCTYNHSFCINSRYFRDGNINCPYFGCSDEFGCIKSPHPKESVGPQFLTSSLSVLALLFAAFILFMWISRKYHMFCWTLDCSHAPPTANLSNSLIEMIEQTGSRIAALEANHATGSAPIRDEAKDLPPSYDSLFPPGGTPAS
ncbi:hypothetical protein HUJ04_002000 [Dendroctonus ponderosae]|uniref:CUB domain-containing protein n=1 Tax=Dendroctonus ponderosae TaxID=77166 RepID=A0AAR5QEU5_DENPD|nr:hypothetical protein HUJ04_002000 [Dendroctonus ponderosae]